MHRTSCLALTVDGHHMLSDGNTGPLVDATQSEADSASPRNLGIDIPEISQLSKQVWDRRSSVCLQYLLPRKLAFLSSEGEDFKTLTSTAASQSFKLISSKLHQQYWPLCLDFGPVTISVVWRFCTLIRKALDREERTGRVLVYCIETDGASRANAAFLLSSFLFLDQHFSPERAVAPFEGEKAPFTLPAFRDATYTPQDYFLYLRDCVNGLAAAVQRNWFEMSTFQLRQYEWLEAPENGDIHQICPELIAFKGPLPPGSIYRVPGEVALPPAHYARVLRRLRVAAVVRLSEADAYDPAPFAAAGMAHHDLFFDDCAAPPPAVVDGFLAVCDSAAAAGGAPVAVHCRAGLGRTGTLIAAWMVRRRGMTPRAAIAWLRIVRPGSVIGPQQHYLETLVPCAPEAGPPDPAPAAALPTSHPPATAAGPPSGSPAGPSSAGHRAATPAAPRSEPTLAQPAAHPADAPWPSAGPGAAALDDASGAASESDEEPDHIAAAMAAAASAAYARRLAQEVRTALALRGGRALLTAAGDGRAAEAPEAATAAADHPPSARRTRSMGSFRGY